MAGNASRQNGEKGGRPLGRKNDATIEKEAARKAYQQLILQRLRPLFESQMTLARGVSYMFRIEEKKNGAREHVVVTDPDEIGDILSQMDEGSPGVFNDQYYYITTKAPENRAIDSMLDRALDKARQALELGGKDGGPIEIKGVTITVRRK